MCNHCHDGRNIYNSAPTYNSDISDIYCRQKKIMNYTYYMIDILGFFYVDVFVGMKFGYI